MEIGNNSKLKELRAIYGDSVLCTNGLFHSICPDHTEVYISKVTNKVDRRTRYITIAVMDNIVISKTRVGYTILNKNNLEWVYRTANIIEYLDENIVCERAKDSVSLISHLGRKICTLESTQEIISIGNNKYIVKSLKSYGDRVILYDRNGGGLIDISDNRSCIIEKSDSDDNVLNITFLNGVSYEYDLSSKICKNKFTGKSEIGIVLW